MIGTEMFSTQLAIKQKQLGEVIKLFLFAVPMGFKPAIHKKMLICLIIDRSEFPQRTSG
jgi:hypothetical protein